MSDEPFTVCLTHNRFYPCVSGVRSSCCWSDFEGDVWKVSEHIMTTTPQERINWLKANPA